MHIENISKKVDYFKKSCIFVKLNKTNMSDFDNTNKGTLFINTKKQKETHPTMKGSINIDGKEYWLSAWAKVHETKGKWLSLSVEPKEAEQTDDSVPPVGDDLPF